MSLSDLACTLGGVLLVLHVFALWQPSVSRDVLLRFPRSLWAGRILTGLALVWVGAIVLNAPLQKFNFLKPYIYIAVPLAYVLIIYLMDELLAPRAFGGILLLLADPMLDAARWHDSPWRLVVTVLAYVWVLAGMVFVLSPFRLRRLIRNVVGDMARYRVVAVFGLILGAVLIGLGLTIY